MGLTSEERLRAITVGGPAPLKGRVQQVEYDLHWPQLFAREAGWLRAALGRRAVRVEHAGSTSVPGLAAKPIIDIVLVVADSADEPAYLPALETAGYLLRIREPDWEQHRMLVRADTDVHVHVFSVGSPEVDRMLAFRDRLRGDDTDRQLYERTKRELAAREWTYVQHYADGKTAVVEDILTRARRSPT
jgi:GrpB-like predicted nucleotidyltransferase (UPF0157 family)